MDFNQQNKVAARWLLGYPEKRQAYIDRMAEFSVLGAVRYTGMPTGTEISRPTQNKGVSLAEMEEQRLWVMTIEDVERTLGEKKLAFLNARRWAEKQQDGEPGRPAWVDITLATYADWFNRRYGCLSYPSRNTMFKWWDDVLNITVRIAIARGCVFKK